jgi:hypothetical protein
MANAGFTFAPTKSFTFNPQVNSLGISKDQSVYIPKCGQPSLAKDAHRKMQETFADQFGMTITYWPKKFQVDKAHFLYGDDTVSGFHNARKLKAVINFASYSAFLTKFGYMSDEELTIFIPIKEFERVWGPSTGKIFPLADDIFLIDDSACERALQQSPPVYVVSDKTDVVNPVDYLAGNYTWKITAKRFDYSYEKNAPEEKFLDSGSGDVSQFGRLPGGENPPDLSDKHEDIDTYTKENFDNTKTSKVYGYYQ